MLIAEANGTPGCGKSFLMSELAAVLASARPVVTFEKIFEQRKKFLNSPFLQFILYLLDLRYAVIHIRLILFLFKYPMNIGRLRNFCKLIVLFHRLLKESPEKEKCVILDEGLIQLLTSISHDCPILINRNTEKIVIRFQQYFKYYIFVNCSLDESENIHRIRQRNNMQNRFDRCDDVALPELLKIKKDNICRIRELLDAKKTVNLDMAEPSIQNLNKILQVIDRK